MSANAVSIEIGIDYPKELRAFREQTQAYKRGEIGHEQFKAIRVNLGIYSQRQEGLYMVRTKFPAGHVAPGILSTLADAADRFATGYVHVTTRQDFQFHYVPLDNLPDILEALYAGGVITLGAGGNTIRNVTTCDYSGACQKEVFGVSHVARAVSSYFLGRPISKGLPRKFKVTFSGCSLDCGEGFIDDIGAVAVGPAEGHEGYGFRLLVGGGGGAVPRLGKLLEEFVPAERVHAHILAVLNVFNRHGTRTNRNRARIKFLIERIGMEKFLGFYREELDAQKDIEPLKFDFVKPSGAGVAPSILLKIPVGDITSEQLRKLDAFFSNNPGVKASSTKNGDILITGVQGDHFKAAWEFFKENGLKPFHADNPGNCVRSCNGSSACNEGITNSKALARILELASEGLNVGDGSPLTVSISGCPNACSLHHTADIGLQGSAKKVEGRLAPHYMVYLGGVPKGPDPKLAKPVIRVPAKNVPGALEKIAATLNDEKLEGENTHEAFERIGMEKFRAELEPFTILPTYEESRDAYLDWDSDKDFNLDEVGPGECGGSALDIIDGFFTQARRDLESAESALGDGDFQLARKAAHNSAIQSAKALLVTYGVEPVSDEETFREFKSKLITRGFVSEKYEPTLAPLEEKVETHTVDAEGWVELHSSFMEECLAAYTRINAKSNVEEEPHASAEYERMDLTGVNCPYNYIKIKLKLEDAAAGTILEAILDDGSPVRNVPQSLKNDGHRILSLDKLENGQYLLVVEKS